MNININILEKIGRDLMNKPSVQNKIISGKHITPEKSRQYFKDIVTKLSELNEQLESPTSLQKRKIVFQFQKYLISAIAWSMGGEQSCQRRQVFAKMSKVWIWNLKK
jgi:hypothetical protein